MSTINAEEEWMTSGEVQRYLGVSTTTVARMIRNGKLHAREDAIDKRLKLVRRADVEKLAQHSIRPGRPRKRVQPEQPETEQEEDKS